MNQTSQEDNFFSIWLPRIIIGLCVVLLVYFTQRTYRFKGTYDDSFLAPENLNLVRGPWANKEYYKRGELGYTGKPLFEDSEVSGATETATSEIAIPAQVPQAATASPPAGTQ